MVKVGDIWVMGGIALTSLLGLLAMCAVTHQWLFLLTVVASPIAFFHSLSLGRSANESMFAAIGAQFASLYAAGLIIAL